MIDIEGMQWADGESYYQISDWLSGQKTFETLIYNNRIFICKKIAHTYVKENKSGGTLVAT